MLKLIEKWNALVRNVKNYLFSDIKNEILRPKKNVLSVSWKVYFSFSVHDNVF